MIFWVFVALLLALGVLVGSSLSAHPSLEPFKLLNIIGLVYDLVGVFVLSELVIRRLAVREFLVKWVAGVCLWGQTLVPLGAAAGAHFLGNGPSSDIASSFFVSLFAFSLIPLTILEAGVLNPQFSFLSDVNLRTRVFGLFLLVFGLSMQLVAAFLDLYSTRSL